MRSLPMQQTAGFICIIPIRPLFPSGSLSTHNRDLHEYTHSWHHYSLYRNLYIYRRRVSSRNLEWWYCISEFKAPLWLNESLLNGLIYLIFIKRTNCLCREREMKRFSFYADNKMIIKSSSRNKEYSPMNQILLSGCSKREKRVLGEKYTSAK